LRQIKPDLTPITHIDLAITTRPNTLAVSLQCYCPGKSLSLLKIGNELIYKFFRFLDVCMRLVKKPPGNLWIRKVAEYRCSIIMSYFSQN